MAGSKSASKAALKWKERTAVATQDYKDGVMNPRTSWQDATANAESTWISGVQEASSKGRFKSGVNKAGNQKWQDGAVTKGADRYAPGVALAEQDYERAMGDVISTIESVRLPQRYPKGDPRNLKRVEAISSALHKKKTGGS